MKGLDTWALLEVLEGSPSARRELRRLRGDELATTEGCVIELSYLASHGAPRAQQARRSALSRLRRRITVLPLDARAVEEAARRLTGGVRRISPLVLASLGAFEAAGCEELLSGNPSEIAGRWRFRVRKFGSGPKK